MPDGSTLQFAEIDRVLRRFDNLFAAMATNTGGFVRTNYHHAPERAIVIDGNDGIQRIIGLSGAVIRSSEASAQQKYIFRIYLVATKHQDGRKWWHKTVEATTTLPSLDEMSVRLQSAWEELKGISEEELAPIPGPDPAQFVRRPSH